MRTLFLLYLLFFCTPLQYASAFSDDELLKTDLVLRNQFQEIIDSALAFFRNRQKSNGLFIYDVLPFKGRELFQDNIVRQAGSFFSLAQAYDGKSEDLKSVLKNAISYFTNNTKTLFEEKNIPFYTSKKRLRIISETQEGYTGASCLFLMGFLELHQKFPEEFPVDTPVYNELLSTLDYYYNRGGGLPDYINLEETYLEKVNKNAEIYATSQYFATLAKYHLAFKKEIFTGSIVSLIKLYDVNWDKHKFELKHVYHWTMYALTYLWQLHNENWGDTIENLIERLHTSYWKYYPVEARMTNNGSQLEGYATYLKYRQMKDLLTREELYTLTYHLRHLSNFQLKATTERKITEKDGTEKTLPLQKAAINVGGFVHKEKDEYHARIDFTQHCLSAFLHHKEIMDGIYENESELFEAKREEWLAEIEREMLANRRKSRLHPVPIKRIYEH